MKATYPTLLTAALASFALVGCRGGGDNLAIVNGEPISMEEFHHFLERKPTVQVQFPQAGSVQAGQAAELPVITTLGFQALRDLVNRRVLLQVAKDKGVYPSDGEVSAELEFQKKRKPDFVPSLVAQGLTIDEIRRELTVDLAKERIITKGVTIPPAAVDKFIAENPTEFQVPEQAKISFLVVKTAADKTTVDAALTAGTPFGTVAKTYSVLPNGREQGAFAPTVVSQMPTVFQNIIAKTPERTVSAWNSIDGQWLKVNVEQKVPSKKIDITDVVKETVRRKLALEQGGQGVDLGKQLIDKLRTAKIDILLSSLKDPWKKAFDTLKESDVQSSTRTGTTGTAAPAGATTGTAPATGAPATP